MNTSTLVQKLWNYCNVLRDDGMSYGDYVEQLTYLLFLKMADERSRPPHNQRSLIPAEYAWASLLARDGDELFDHYRHALEALGTEKGTLALIFNKAQNKFQDPAKLRRVIVDLIDKENWSALSADVKGDAYEGLLEKNAQDLKSGAGQYFHAARADPRHGGLHRAQARRDHPPEALHECDVHTLLRLPTGLFYAQGVKANVLFFDKKPARETPWTKKLWIYDLRTNKHFTLKTNPLRREHLDEFVRLYNPANRHDRAPTWSLATVPLPRPSPASGDGGNTAERGVNGRWRAYEYDELITRDKASLDIFWLKDDSSRIPITFRRRT